VTVGLKFPKPVRVKKAPHPLQRSRMRRRRARRIDRETPAEKYYKGWIHTRWCQGAGTVPRSQNILNSRRHRSRAA
jgi:hypothetical protein